MLATITLTLLAAGPVRAIEITEQEWDLLPPWCAHTLTGNPQRGPSRYQELLKRYGQDFAHMHHHCWGVVEEMRSMNTSVSAQLRGGYTGAALGDYDYVLRNTRPGFPFRLETLRRKASVLQRRGQLAQALAAAEQAIKEFPTEVEGYVAAASAHLAAKRRDLADQVLATGIDSVRETDRLKHARTVLLAP